MKKTIVFISLILNCLSGFSQNLKIQSSAVTFKIKHVLGTTADGSFKGFVGTILFDENDLGSASLKATLDSKTIDTDNGSRDKTMRSIEYFDVEKYPKITMNSTKIEKSDEPNKYIGYFNLTIKNVTKNIKIPLSIIKKGNQVTFTTNFVINRIEYGVGGKSSMLSDKANLSIVVKTQI